MDRKCYPSARFVALTENESITSAKKNYFIWTITVTILFCIAVVLFSYKALLRNDNLQSPSNDGYFFWKKGNFPIKLYNPEKFFDRLKNQTSNDELEFSCKKSETELKVIPSIYIEDFPKRFYSICNYINLDLLLYYEHLINEYEPKKLKLIFNEYQSNLSSVKKPEDFVTFLASLKSTKCQFYATYLKQEKHDLELTNFVNYFAFTAELNHWYNYLDLLRNYLSGYQSQKLKEYFINCTEKNFRKYTEATQMQLFHFVYSFHVTEKKLQEINSVINEWAGPVKAKVYNESVIFYGKVVVLSEINKKILDLNVTFQKYVFVFAIHTIYLDENVELPGVNLAIVAPNWLFSNKIKIILSGTPGEEYKNETASANQPGKPGNPGKSAGNFLGVGNFNEEYLLVFVDGGKGGNGQDGAKGSDGINNTYPDPPVNRPACMTKINVFNNSFGQIITHYKVFNKEGCGGSGTDGGVGGVGGAGGVITLITRNSVKIRKGLNGLTGIPGKGGAGGAGGQYGCFYEVFDVNEEILYRVTTVKCSPKNILPAGSSGRDNYNSGGKILPIAKKNLTVPNCLIWFLQFAGSDLVKHNDANLIMFLKDFDHFYNNNETNLNNIISEYKLIKRLGKIELYELFQRKILKLTERYNTEISPFLKYLKSIVLGRILKLKTKVNFFFIDFKIFLNVIKSSIKSPNDLSVGPITYLNKKIEIKCEHIKVKLNRVRTKLSTLISETDKDIRKFYYRNDTKFLNLALKKKSDFCGIIMDIDTTNKIINWFLKNLNSNHTQLLDTGDTLLLTEDTCFGQKIFSENFLIHHNLSDKKKIAKYLQDLKNSLDILKKSNTFSKEENNLLEELIDELVRFIVLYDFREWKDLENLFLETLNDLELRKSKDLKEKEEVEFLKTEFKNVLISIMHKLAVNAVRQNLPSFISLSPHLKLSRKETETKDVFTHINFLKDISGQETFCKNQLKAVFDKHSAVGEFYFWSNSEIRDELEKLFSGEEIDIKSNLVNRHIFDKNFVQFMTLKLEFECSLSSKSCEKHLQDILLDFKIEITHSGYSYYNWEGETHIVISEKVNLDYSFRMQDNKNPEIYNSFFKKCQEGEIKLSPFTTWTIRLLPLNNRADYTTLKPFITTVNLRLTGTGTYMY